MAVMWRYGDNVKISFHSIKVDVSDKKNWNIYVYKHI